MRAREEKENNKYYGCFEIKCKEVIIWKRKGKAKGETRGKKKHLGKAK